MDKARKHPYQIYLADEHRTLAVGMVEKAKGFTETGSEIYHGNVPEGVDHDNH